MKEKLQTLEYVITMTDNKHTKDPQWQKPTLNAALETRDHE